MQKKRRQIRRTKTSAKYKLPEDADINYKNINLLKKYIDGRGKIIARRVSGLNGKQQRKLTTAVKHARFLALLTTGSARR